MTEPDAAASTTNAMDNRKIQVIFFSRQPKYVVADTPVHVPTRMRRFGLSEIVNHLLALDMPVPFDFIIDGRFLKTSLQSYIDSQSVSTETVLRIEFVEARMPPKETNTFMHDDWISSVKIHTTLPFVVTGSYDGVARVWTKSNECVQQLSVHSAPIKCVAWTTQSDYQIGLPRIFVGSQDQTVSAFSFSDNGTESALLYTCVGHTGSVESVSVSDDSTMIATGSWDQTIRVWTTDPEDVETTEEERTSKKRVKLSIPRKIKSSEMTLEGHAGAVTGVAFAHDSDGNNTVYSCSTDHSVREWDVEGQTNTLTMNCENAVNGLSVQAGSRLIATGHADGMVRLWDPRSKEGMVVKMKFAGHTNWVSCVTWSPESSFHLASGSYDGTVRVWDVRSTNPVHVLAAADSVEEPRVFGIDWAGETMCVGGNDSKLRMFQTTASSAPSQ